MSTTESLPTAGPDEFVITRVFDAPPHMVFTAWVDPKQMAQWWGPSEFTNPVCEMDVRPGGSYRIVMRSPAGMDCPMRGTFQEIDPPSRLVMTMDCSEHAPAWHDMIKPDRRPDETNPAGIMLFTITFDDLNGKTRLTVRAKLASPEIRDSMVKLGMSEGWSQSLDRLTALLADKSAP